MFIQFKFLTSLRNDLRNVGWLVCFFPSSFLLLLFSMHDAQVNGALSYPGVIIVH